MCGGSGTRLWPLSRTGFPKQFLVLSGTISLFQQAIDRVNNLASDNIQIEETLIVTGEEHRFLALDQLREIKLTNARLLLEPVARNTAPALTLAALHARENGEDPILVVTPADQTVINTTAFKEALQNSIREAADGSIVILGVTPDKPETGYGYIKIDSLRALAEGQGPSRIHYEVDSFVEKPDAKVAERYLLEGGYYWNSGIFVLKASTWLKALMQFHPTIANLTQLAWSNKTNDLPFIRPDKVAFANIPSDSVDYAVMEPVSAGQQENNFPFALKMVPLDAGWNDLGAWDALWQVGEKDKQGNVLNGDTLAINTNNTLINASSRLVGTVGVKNLVIIETADALLVADLSQSQDVQKIFAVLQKQKREESNLHRKVLRPWGWYDCIDEGTRFKVKRIQVKSGASLSLQRHQHRAEHWVVVKGIAEVTCGDKIITLTENQSTYIPLGEVHRLSNPGSTPLEIIEVQSGDYLGEDDIERFEDTYGRSN